MLVKHIGAAQTNPNIDSLEKTATINLHFPLKTLAGTYPQPWINPTFGLVHLKYSKDNAINRFIITQVRGARASSMPYKKPILILLILLTEEAAQKQLHIPAQQV